MFLQEKDEFYYEQESIQEALILQQNATLEEYIPSVNYYRVEALRDAYVAVN
jgi:hypothetical protein